MNVSPIPTTRIHKDHPKDQIIGDINSATQTRRMIKISEEHAMVSYIKKQRRTNHKDYQNCLFACFLSQNEPKKVIQALTDPSWIEAMQEELLQFKLQNVWTLVDLPIGKRAIGTKWVFRNKKDERGIVIRNKARLVAQGYTQEEGINYDEVFAPVARIEAIRLFLAYASFMGFIVYQMDVKSAFLYGTIEEEMSSIGELTFFLRIGRNNSNEELIIISQDKYVADILKKFDFVTVKTASTHMKPNKALVKNEEAKNVDVHLYRSMIRSLMCLTASRPNITFADYAGASLDRKSTIGGCQFLRKRKQRKDSAPTKSTTEETTPEKNVATPSCDPPKSGEDRMKLIELMNLVHSFGKEKKSRTSPFFKRLRKVGSASRVCVLEEQEIEFKKVVEKPVVSVAATTKSIPVSAAEVVTIASTNVEIPNEFTLAQTLIEIKTAKPKPVTTAATTFTSVRPRAKGIIFHDQEEQVFASTKTFSSSQSQLSQVKDKGKGIMVEPEVSLKKKDQVALDEEMARNLEAQLQDELIEEEKLARQKEEEANIALIESWDNIQAMMEADFELDQRLQAEEQGEITIEERSRLFIELTNRRKKHIAKLRAKEIRRKPPTKAQNRNQMSTCLKNMAGYKHGQLKGKSYDEIQKLAGDELESDMSKKQKIDEQVEIEKDDQEEAEMKRHIEIVKDDDVAIVAIPLATKPLVIVDYKIDKDGRMGYFKLIRVDGSLKSRSNIGGLNSKRRKMTTWIFDTVDAATTKSIPVSAAEVVTTASTNVKIPNELNLAQTLIEIKTIKPKPITTAATTVTSVRPRAKGIIFHDQEEQLEVPLKKKDRVDLDEEMARNLKARLQAELIEEEMSYKVKRKKNQHSFEIESWYKHTSYDGDDLEIVQSKTKAEGSSKRAGNDLEQEKAKKQKADDDQEDTGMKRHIEIVKDDEVAIDAIPLATKPSVIVDYKIDKDGRMGYFKLIRTDGSSKRYSSMIKMLQGIDKEDLETLWKLVKAKYENTRPDDEYERVLWGDLKVMFEPDIKSDVWINLQGYKVTIWKLFDKCGVHFIKEDFRKHFITKKELSVEQDFWLKHSSLSETPVMSHTPVRIEAPSELPKVSLVNESLKRLKYQLANFDKVVKKRLRYDAITAGYWGFEHTKECFVTEIIPFLKVLKDTFNAFDKTLLDENTEVQTVFNQIEAAVDQVKPTTNASGSKPSGNTKNNRITRPPSSNQKNKVEDYPRKVNSSLNKTNSISEPISNAHVKHSMRNAKFESICANGNKCLFDANHDMYLVDFVNDVNVHSKSKSKRNKTRKAWKPTGKVFIDVGFKWKPTGRFFTIVGNSCPLTRITPKKIVHIQGNHSNSLKQPKPENKVL
ncbi:putative ribonuclease H-like domain-containing protein [Tanacetum coccineum]